MYIFLLVVPPPPPRRQPPVTEPSTVLPTSKSSDACVSSGAMPPGVDVAAFPEHPPSESPEAEQPSENGPEYSPPPENSSDEKPGDEPMMTDQRNERSSSEDPNDDNASTCVNINSDSVDTFSTTSDLQQKEMPSSEDGQLENGKATTEDNEDNSTNDKMAKSEMRPMRNPSVDEQIVEVEVHKELDG